MDSPGTGMGAAAVQRIAITGATGLVGTALAGALHGAGHSVVAISRNPAPGGVRWDPAREQIDVAALHGVDAVVHLAGASIAGSRWTDRRKSLLASSRIEPTRWLSTVLAGLARRPAVLISASATGYYGDRGEETLTEASAPGSDFLANLSAAWERAADPARQAGIRVVHPRFGIVLSRQGGALAKMLPPFRLGLGGPMGSGRQWMSWITIDDAVRAIIHLIAEEQLSGPVNVVAPHPVRNVEFARAIGAAIHRPALLRMPAVALRALLGELADAALLASQRVEPAALSASGFVAHHATITAALDYCL